jgi:SAM-dependent methyltransferase
VANVINSVRKHWYIATTARRLSRDEWTADYYYETGGSRIVPCRRCPKFDAAKTACRVPFGSPLRKCVTASIEAHLRVAKGKNVLEVGFLGSALPRRVVEAVGGTWTGVEPVLSRKTGRHVARGSAAALPFADESFDIVLASQSIEHWQEHSAELPPPPSYAECFAEIHRVLKPGGFVYLDAPIHLHGYEMFVLGDVDRISGLFAPTAWRDVKIERWRYEHEPLPRYAPPPKDVARWDERYPGYPDDAVATILASRSVWLVVVTAYKVPAAGTLAGET